MGHAGPGHGADQFGDHGHFAPAKYGEAFGGGQGFHAVPRYRGFGVVAGQEGGSGRVVARLGQFEAHHCPEEFVGDLGEQPGAITGSFVGADGAAVFQIAQRRQRRIDYVMPGFAPEGGDHGQAAGILFVGGIVQPGLFRVGGETTERRLHCAVLGPVSAAEAAWGTRPLEWRSHLNFLLLDVREKGTALAPPGSACGQAGP